MTYAIAEQIVAGKRFGGRNAVTGEMEAEIDFSRRPGTVKQRVPQRERSTFWAAFDKVIADYKKSNEGKTPLANGLFTDDAYYLFDIIDGRPINVHRRKINAENKEIIEGFDRTYKSEIYRGASNASGRLDAILSGSNRDSRHASTDEDVQSRDGDGGLDFKGVSQERKTPSNEIGNNSEIQRSEKDSGVRYSRVSDKSRIDEFDKARREGRTIKTIRSFVEVDGKLYSPMASMEKGADGKYHLGEPVGEIKDGKFVGYLQKADERPDLAIWDDDSKSYKFGLKKEGNVVDANGKPVISEKTGKEIKQSDITALYNPYWHSSNSALNDQFTSAYKRPNLVTVECEILADEAGSGITLKMLRYNAAKALKQQGVTAKTVGKEEYERRVDDMVNDARANHEGSYWAEKANASIGRHDWHTGTVAKDLPIGEKRSVYLTRELLPVRIMSTEETADKIISQLGKNLNKSGAYNAQVFPPQLAKALEERGMKLSHGVDDDGIRYSRGPRHPNPNPGNYMDKTDPQKYTMKNILKEAGVETARF